MWYFSTEERWSCRCAAPASSVGWGVTAGPTSPSVKLLWEEANSAATVCERVWELHLRCARSMQENLPTFFFFFVFFLFPSLVTGKGSIFSFHIWSYGAPPASSTLLMLYKHPYFVWDLNILECFFFFFLSFWLWLLHLTVHFKQGHNPFKAKDWRGIILALAAVSQRSCLFTVLFMIWSEATQLLMQMSLLKTNI